VSVKEELEEQKLRAEILALQAEAAKHMAETRVAEENFRFNSRNNTTNDIKSDVARIYTFYEQVKSESVSKCMEKLGEWSRRDPGQPIKIILNSPGGSVLDGLALYDYIRELRTLGHQVEVIALGMAASMGGVLLQSGDKRTMGKNAWLLIHEVSTGAIGNISEMEEELEFSKRLQDGIVSILAERSSMTTTQIKRKWKKTDWWLSAQEALELGFVDAIQ
jgi:ATP-dependent Clp endopeptidase proteolytic subunit ClpP